MKEQETMIRLKADNEIGNRHISVEKHNSLDYPRHWHDYFEIEIVVGGSGTHVFNGTAYPISKGDVYILTPIDFHEIKSPSPIELINISCDEMLISEDMRGFLYSMNFEKLHHFAKEDFESILMAAELLNRECRINGSCINQLLEYLISRFINSNIHNSRLYFNQEHITGIKKAVAYLELHFREKVTLKQLSDISGYNPTYFSELFRKFTGETYIERLTVLRINYAKTLLTSGLSVSDACFESGFGSLSNFLTVFKAKCGTSPSKYRNKNNE